MCFQLWDCRGKGTGWPPTSMPSRSPSQTSWCLKPPSGHAETAVNRLGDSKSLFTVSLLKCFQLLGHLWWSPRKGGQLWPEEEEDYYNCFWCWRQWWRRQCQAEDEEWQGSWRGLQCQGNVQGRARIFHCWAINNQIMVIFTRFTRPEKRYPLRRSRRLTSKLVTLEISPCLALPPLLG